MQTGSKPLRSVQFPLIPRSQLPNCQRDHQIAANLLLMLKSSILGTGLRKMVVNVEVVSDTVW